MNRNPHHRSGVTLVETVSRITKSDLSSKSFTLCKTFKKAYETEKHCNAFSFCKKNQSWFQLLEGALQIYLFSVNCCIQASPIVVDSAADYEPCVSVHVGLICVFLNLSDISLCWCSSPASTQQLLTAANNLVTDFISEERRWSGGGWIEDGNTRLDIWKAFGNNVRALTAESKDWDK